MSDIDPNKEITDEELLEHVMKVAPESVEVIKRVLENYKEAIKNLADR